MDWTIRSVTCSLTSNACYISVVCGCHIPIKVVIVNCSRILVNLPFCKWEHPSTHNEGLQDDRRLQYAYHHHHHLVAHSKSIAVSTMRRQEGRSDARRNAEWSPRLSGLRSLSIVQSQDWRGRPLGRRQSTGRQLVDARSAREWSSEAATRAICPNSLRRRCCISEETNMPMPCFKIGQTFFISQI